jgi:DNA-binding protein H-NS
MTTSHTIHLTETKSVRANGHEEPQAKPPALPFDPATLPDDLLPAIRDAAQREIDARLEQRRAIALAALREQAEAAQALGIPLARLKAFLEGKDDGALTAAGAKVDGRSLVAPLYRNPADPSQTWSGRGAAPSWIEFGSETRPPRQPGGNPIKVPHPKFLISKNDGNDPT